MSSMSPARARQFWADTFRLLEISAAKRNDDALAHAVEIAERFPEQAAESSFLLACAYNRAGHEEQALRTLEAALDRGSCWHDSLLLWSPSLKPLQNRPRFKRVLARSKTMIDALEAGTRASVDMFPPRTVAAGASPLLLPLHGERIFRGATTNTGLQPSKGVCSLRFHDRRSGERATRFGGAGRTSHLTASDPSGMFRQRTRRCAGRTLSTAPGSC